MTHQALIIFAKNPVAGKVKTRLAETIGKHAALTVYKQLLEHTRAATEVLPIDKYVFYSDEILHGDLWDEKKYGKELQHGQDLGERMKDAFERIFSKGYQQAVIIGTDCPGLNEEIIKAAFSRLLQHDVIIGPAADGGYYLLGLKKLASTLFEKIKWSTSTVLAETLGRCEALRLTHSRLPVLSDVDEEKDLLLTKLEW